MSDIGQCSACRFPLTIREEMNTRRGRIGLQACNAACTNEADPYDSDTKSLNIRSILGMRSIGRGLTGLQSFFAWMDMIPPVSWKPYSMYVRNLAAASMEACLDNMLTASANLYLKLGAGQDEVIDVAVTCDGTWSKRGFDAIILYGIMAVIAWETGQVLDFEIMNKYCRICQYKASQMKKDGVSSSSKEFEEWWEEHSTSCDQNHYGSSPAMEAAAALVIWGRSEEKLRLRYTEVISDGDSKTLAMLNSAMPYGEGVKIKKHECILHVQKIVRTRLMKLKETSVPLPPVAKGKGKGKMKAIEEEEEEEMEVVEEEIEEVEESMEENSEEQGKKKGGRKKAGCLRWGGKGARLNITNMNILQAYYGKAIRKHPNDLAGMKKACKAVFYHSASTDSKPQHQFFPVGPESWCKYHRAEAQGQPIPHE